MGGEACKSIYLNPSDSLVTDLQLADGALLQAMVDPGLEAWLGYHPLGVKVHEVLTKIREVAEAAHLAPDVGREANRYAAALAAALVKGIAQSPGAAP